MWLLIRDIVYLCLIGIWMIMFFLARAMANDLLPLLIVILFMNVDSRISEIVKRLKEMK